ncbi:MAG: BrnA antitoxin family protein [Alphaproteobacteria bacterium]|nr:BrnA antitoxin family protein [Alphaproteobacteria bacterium]
MQTVKKDRSTKRTRRLHEDRTDWKRVAAMTEEEIMAASLADPDAQPTTAADWVGAYQPNRIGKESITIRLDKDVIEWFRAKGEGYQTRINDALRRHIARRKAS